MIAMALACEPAILIADEPTTALDVTIQAEILELLVGLKERLGMAMIFVSHDLGVVAQVADRLLVMYAGQVVESADASEAFRAPRHPYTEGLLSSIPRSDRRVGRLEVIPGAVPSPRAWPEGCRFHPRCKYAWERCRRSAPPLLGESRLSRCWLEEEPERRRMVTGHASGGGSPAGGRGSQAAEGGVAADEGGSRARGGSQAEGRGSRLRSQGSGPGRRGRRTRGRHETARRGSDA